MAGTLLHSDGFISFLWLTDLPWYGWAPLVFVLGAMVGSFLNVCIYRLPLEKSILWPGSHCGRCYQPIRWYDNIPLLSYWLLRGRCRTCGAAFSVRYFFIELLTALSLVGLFYLEVDQNIHQLDATVLGPHRFAAGRLMIFAFHAVLFCFLLAASFCDFDYQIIPLPLTVTGTLVGLIWSMLYPWPWPYLPAEITRGIPVGQVFVAEGRSLFKEGLFPWPLWWPLPNLLTPGGNWQTGLATSLAGFLAGTLVLRVIRFLFGIGGGAEYMEDEMLDPEDRPRGLIGRWASWFGRVGGKALGLGDADLMMMAGCFLGWQPILVAFIVGLVPGLVMGFGQVLLRGNQPFAYGPALALGVLFSWLTWSIWLAPYFQQVFFEPTLVLTVAVAGIILLPLAGLVLRFLHWLRGVEVSD